jgi:exopolyphosphatase / guanosine-5'-triphosphate,3'-diphosphate pyrophosphatase
MRAAVLDLGTNTFNLLIAENDSAEGFKILFNTKIPVKLGEGGINNGEITDAAYKRGITAINEHFKSINYYKADKIKAYGTSALRTAKNGIQFIKEIKNNTGIEVEIISGDLEAELIYYGVRQTFNMSSEKYLILDIGGGSNEFIIADNKEIFWKKSYPLGIARLLGKFKPSDPITSFEIEDLDKYLAFELTDLFEKIREEKITTIIGASGSFETFVAMIKKIDNFVSQAALVPGSVQISPRDFEDLYQLLIRSTSDERSLMKGLEPMRIEMIVLACHFVKFILRSTNIRNIIQSNFALKEGAILKLFLGNYN